MLSFSPNNNHTWMLRLVNSTLLVLLLACIWILIQTKQHERFVPTAAPTAAPTDGLGPVDVFLILGQSNASGENLTDGLQLYQTSKTAPLKFKPDARWQASSPRSGTILQYNMFDSWSWADHCNKTAPSPV